MKQALVWITCAGMLCGCVSVTEAGQRVRYVMHSEAPADCRFLGEIDVGSSASGFVYLPNDIRETKILMRNKCAALGGNLLVIDAIMAGPPMSGSQQNKFSGSGRAYRCPEVKNEKSSNIAPNRSPSSN